MTFNFTKYWKKYGEPITGISIFIFICFSWYMIYQDHQLKLEINENCGWGGEDYQCYCEKYDALMIQSKMDNKVNLTDFLNG